jgi:hypothetical protein
MEQELFTFPGRFFYCRGIFTFSWAFLPCLWVYLPLYGRIYFCGGDFTFPGMFLQFAMDVLLCRGCIYLCVGVFISVGVILHCQECFCNLLWTFCFAVGVFTSGRIYFCGGDFTLPGMFLQFAMGFTLLWVYLPLYGRIYFCGGDFTLPGMFLQISMGVLLCGYIYLCVGVFTSVWAILHCQERFCKLLSTSTSVTSFTSAWATYILTVNMI